jgi:hypothetical protein
VTNLDIHDNARSAKTFGVSSYHIVTPLDAQVELVGRILAHWREGFGAKRVPNRVDAMNLVQVSRTLEDVKREIMGNRNGTPTVVATCARERENVVTFHDLKDRFHNDSETPYLLIFGTGYGLADEILDGADMILEPIGNPSGWNHLSVRGAVAIVLDRLLGAR